MKNYPLHSGDKERRRLHIQAQAILPLTETMLTGASIVPGARVLELGCASGEMTQLLASRVGPSGTVIAMDRDPAQLEAAVVRLANAGFQNVQFVLSDLDHYDPEQTFDAVVGRYFLLYIPQPEAAVARMAKWVRSGGALAFLEMDFFRGVHSSVWPPVSPATHEAIVFIGDVMLDAGINPHMAVRLPSILSHYGDVHAHTCAPLQFGANSVELPLEAVRSVTPMARKLGRADADHHDVDALLRSELLNRDQHTVTMPPISVAAWVQLP
ncbi:MAG: methyltransferase domain-containing protein [Pseudomonadota bacterium]